MQLPKVIGHSINIIYITKYGVRGQVWVTPCSILIHLVCISGGDFETPKTPFGSDLAFIQSETSLL